MPGRAQRLERRPPAGRVGTQPVHAGSETGAPAAAHQLAFSNRRKRAPVDLRLLRTITRELFVLVPQVSPAQLAICLVGDAEMTEINQTFLRHAGSTDVITFDYSEPQARSAAQAGLQGEIFICLDEALRQARRFRTTWQAEVIRYLVHGVLHLLGYDDGTALPRRRMKREENRLVSALAARFALSRLARKPRLRP